MKKDKQSIIASYRLEQLITVPGLMIDVHYKMTGQPVHHPNADLTQAHRHEFYTLAVTGKQASQHMVDFRLVDMPPESMFLLAPWQVHLSTDADRVIDAFLISFTADFLPAGFPVFAFMYGASCYPGCSCLYGCMAPLRTAATGIYQSQGFAGAGIAALPGGSADTVYALSPGKQQWAIVTTDLLVRYRELMEKHILSWSSCGEYARALHVTTDHLNEMVKQGTGQTASALLAARRILEAKRMLLHSSHGIKEIAWYLQFNEVTYFNRFFKQHTGQTPVAFRISSREKYNYTPE